MGINGIFMAFQPLRRFSNLFTAYPGSGVAWNKAKRSKNDVF